MSGARAPRHAEVMAALFAVETGGAALRSVVTDREYVAAGLRAVAIGAAAAYSGGPDGDVWALFRDRVPAVCWMRSH